MVSFVTMKGSSDGRVVEFVVRRRGGDTVAQSRAVKVFAITNFVLAGVWFLYIVMLLVLLTSMLNRLSFSSPSPDPLEDLVILTYGLYGMLALYIPGLIAFTGAGIGLSKRAWWGFYWHLAAALLAAVSCFGLVYTAVAFGFALQPSFRAALLAKKNAESIDLQELPA